ncbi:MAG: VOC family protein [Gammaproteobacteria bacterium]|nr:VOC family protein [Gammaproteobacteria bacterium]
MIDHIGFVISDVKRSKEFYCKCLAPLGIELLVEFEGWVGYGRNGKPDLWFGADGEPHQPMHIAFDAGDRDTVDRFYQQGIEAGGQDNGTPGIRKIYHPHYYGAFLLDPDGHNIEAVCHKPE